MFMWMYAHMFICHGLHREVRGQLVEISSRPLPYGSQGSNSDGQAW